MDYKQLHRAPTFVLFAFAACWGGLLFLLVAIRPAPVVFVDEAAYYLPIIYGTDPANYQRWGMTAYPSYLYFFVFSQLPSSNLQLWIKALNSILVAATALPAYAVARRYLSEKCAVAFTVLVITAPVSSFARYVMPECLYFFGFWLALLAVLSLEDRSFLLSAVLGGVFAGLLALVKPHALSLSVAFSLYFILRSPREMRAFAASALQAAAFVLTHAGVGFILSGHWLWSIFAGVYADVLITSQSYVDAVAGFQNLFGHVVALATIIGPPLVVAFAMGWRKLTEQRPFSMRDKETNLAIMACCLLGVMVCMTIYYSQSVFQTAPMAERITRLHGRYYLYVFPLFILLVATCCLNCSSGAVQRLISRRVCAASVGIASCSGWIVAFLFEVGPIDFVDMTLWGGRAKILICLGHTVLAAGFVYGVRSVRTQLRLITGLWFIVGPLTTFALLVVSPPGNQNQRGIDVVFHGDQWSPIKALIKRPDGIIFGNRSDPTALARTMFYLRSMSLARFAPANNTISDADIPESARWALLAPKVIYLGIAATVKEGELTLVTPSRH